MPRPTNGTSSRARWGFARWLALVLCPVLSAADVVVGPPADSRADSSSLLAEAVERALATGSRKIVVAPGTYHIHGDDARERFVWVANNDAGLRRTAFPVWGARKLVIEGAGARLVLHGQGMMAFMIHDSEDVTIRGFEIDWDRALHAQARVTAVNAEIVQTGPNRFRFRHAWTGIPRVGSVVVAKGMLMPNRMSPAIHIAGSRRVTVEDVIVRHAGAMGLIAESSADLTVRRYQVRLAPGSPRLVTTTADGTHFCQQPGSRMEAGPAVTLRACEDVSIMNNRIELPEPATIRQLTPTAGLIVRDNTGLSTDAAAATESNK